MATLKSHIDSYLTWREREGLAPKSIKNMRTYLARFDRVVSPHRLSRLTRHDVDRWAQALKPYSPQTRVNEASTLRGFLTWAHREGLAPELVAFIPRYRMPKHVPRTQSRDAINRLRAILPNDRARLIIGLMVHSGLRVGEVARLEVGDVDLTGRQVRVCGKAGHERVVPVPVVVADLLASQIRRVSNGPLIRSQVRPEYGVSAAYLSQLVSGWFTAAGLKSAPGDGISAHALRHTAASAVLDACRDVTIVQRLLGHSRLATTAVYLRVADLGDLRNAVDAAAV